MTGKRQMTVQTNIKYIYIYVCISLYHNISLVTNSNDVTVIFRSLR